MAAPLIVVSCDALRRAPLLLVLMSALMMVQTVPLLRFAAYRCALLVRLQLQVAHCCRFQKFTRIRVQVKQAKKDPEPLAAFLLGGFPF